MTKGDDMPKVRIIADTFIAGEPVKAGKKPLEVDEQTARTLVANYKAEYVEEKQKPAEGPRQDPKAEMMALIEKCETIDELNALEDHELMKGLKGKEKESVTEAAFKKADELEKAAKDADAK